MKKSNKIKALAIIIALLLTVTAVFVGCGDKGEDKKDDDTTKTAETTVAQTNASTETTVPKVDATEDEEVVEDADATLGEPDSMSYIAPGTKGFTLDQLRTALVKFGKSGDISYIDQYTLYKSDEIVDGMIKNITCNGNMELSSELSTNANHWISNNFDGLRDMFMKEDFAPSDVTCVFSVDADGTDLNGLNAENEYFAENNDKDFYELVKEAVNETFKDEAEKVTYKSLCYAEVGISENTEDGSETSYENILVIETDAGYFLLLDIPDTN